MGWIVIEFLFYVKGFSILTIAPPRATMKAKSFSTKKENDMYHGWTESQEQIDARTLRRALNEDAINLYFRQTPEGDADELANIVDWVNTDPAHLLVAGNRDENPAETAYQMERDGTETSPIIWGGEVYYQNCAGGDDMPF